MGRCVGRAAEGSGLGPERILEWFEDWAVEVQPLARGIKDILFPVGEQGMYFSEGLEIYDKILNLLQVTARERAQIRRLWRWEEIGVIK